MTRRYGWLRRVALAGAGVAATGLVAYAGLVASTWSSLPHGDCRLAILMFHAVVPDSVRPARYWIRESDFARQMEELRRIGVASRPLGDILEALKGREEGGNCPFLDREVVLTFDMDGPLHYRELAVPHMRRNGFQGAFFVTTGYLRDATLAGEVAALAEAGMTLGSHTEWHVDMRRVRTDSLIASLERSRAALERLTGETVVAVAAPGGRYDERVIEAVRAAGYSAFFNSDLCYVGPDAEPLRLCRIQIRGDGGMTALDALTSARRISVDAANWRIKRLVEAVVGRDLYRRLNRLRTGHQGPGS